MQEVAQLSQFDEELYKVCENVHTCGNLVMTKLVRAANQSLWHIHVKDFILTN